MEDKAEYLLKIVVGSDRRVNIMSPDGLSDAGILMDVGQVCLNLARNNKVTLPGVEAPSVPMRKDLEA